MGNVGGTKNAPTSAAAKTFVHFGPPGEAGAALVVANLKQASPSQDSRNDADVEVVIGSDFQGVAPEAVAFANLAKHPTPRPTC